MAPGRSVEEGRGRAALRGGGGGGFRRYATYGSATLAGVFTNTVFGFIMAYTYIALWDQRPQLGGYDHVAGADLSCGWVRRC